MRRARALLMTAAALAGAACSAGAEPPCASAADCNGWECRAGTCIAVPGRVALGGSCAEDVQCQSQSCVAGSCQPATR